LHGDGRREGVFIQVAARDKQFAQEAWGALLCRAKRGVHPIRGDLARIDQQFTQTPSAGPDREVGWAGRLQAKGWRCLGRFRRCGVSG
jgi:hypothetical protein